MGIWQWGNQEAVYPASMLAWAREHDVLEDVIGFLYFRSDLLYHQTDDHAFPTPRSWEMGSKLLKTTKTAKERKELLQATVGTGAAQEFTWEATGDDFFIMRKSGATDFTFDNVSVKEIL